VYNGDGRGLGLKLDSFILNSLGKQSKTKGFLKIQRINQSQEQIEKIQLKKFTSYTRRVSLRRDIFQRKEGRKKRVVTKLNKGCVTQMALPIYI
jgi:hypothetical protein